MVVPEIGGLQVLLKLWYQKMISLSERNRRKKLLGADRGAIVVLVASKRIT